MHPRARSSFVPYGSTFCFLLRNFNSSKGCLPWRISIWGWSRILGIYLVYLDQTFPCRIKSSRNNNWPISLKMLHIKPAAGTKVSVSYNLLFFPLGALQNTRYAGWSWHWVRYRPFFPWRLVSWMYQVFAFCVPRRLTQPCLIFPWIHQSLWVHRVALDLWGFFWIHDRFLPTSHWWLSLSPPAQERASENLTSPRGLMMASIVLTNPSLNMIVWICLKRFG